MHWQRYNISPSNIELVFFMWHSLFQMQRPSFSGCHFVPSRIVTLSALMWHTHNVRQYAVCTQKTFRSRAVFVMSSVVIPHGITQYVVGVCKCQLDLLNVVWTTCHIAVCTQPQPTTAVVSVKTSAGNHGYAQRITLESQKQPYVFLQSKLTSLIPVLQNNKTLSLVKVPQNSLCLRNIFKHGY